MPDAYRLTVNSFDGALIDVFYRKMEVIIDNFKDILFDLDGTITDPKTGITNSVAYALKKFGITVNDLDRLTGFIGPPLKDSFIEYYDFSEDEAALAVKYYREYFGEKGIYQNTVYPDMNDLLNDLKNMGKTLVIATSKPTIYAKKILEYFNLIDYFEFVAGSELNGLRNKKSEVIAYALEACGIVDRSSSVMVGDRKHDILGAKEVGITSVGVLYGYESISEINSVDPDYIRKGS